MSKVLITGITGFLGSHIAEILIQNDFKVIGLKREGSSTARCVEFYHGVEWVDLDDDNVWMDLVVEMKPSIIIHTAWIGVAAEERNDLFTQAKNITFLTELLMLAKKLQICKFINLGSQAEYGKIDGIIDEESPANPSTAYGSIKIVSLQIFKAFCNQNDINWIWLRVFSVFGERESVNWLIPSVICKIQNGNEMDFTPGLQRYAYLYVRDFANIILRVVTSSVESGVYNISSNEALTLKEIIQRIKDKLKPEFRLNFGSLPYREDQSMHIQGDISKLEQQLGHLSFTKLDLALNKTLDHYISTYKHQE